MQILHAGECAVVLTVSYEKTRDAVSAIRKIYQAVHRNLHPGVVSVRPGLDSILIEFSRDSSPEAWLQNLQAMDFEAFEPENLSDKICVVPICYDFGYDISHIAEQTELSKEEIIQIHSSVDYNVWMIGFMAGFPYMAELPVELQIQRKVSPDLKVPEGSVAIAEEYCGIYPFDSPGGWHVVGRTPWKIIDYARPIPWTFDYGMTVRFQPVSMEEFEAIRNSQ